MKSKNSSLYLVLTLAIIFGASQGARIFIAQNNDSDLEAYMTGGGPWRVVQDGVCGNPCSTSSDCRSGGDNNYACIDSKCLLMYLRNCDAGAPYACDGNAGCMMPPTTYMSYYTAYASREACLRECNNTGDMCSADEDCPDKPESCEKGVCLALEKNNQRYSQCSLVSECGTDPCVNGKCQGRCGNGIFDTNYAEVCDTALNNGKCRINVPGAGQSWGNCINCSVCRWDPPEQVCGNGNREEGEQCDDGNENDDDGCTNDCRQDFCKGGRLSTLQCSNSRGRSSYGRCLYNECLIDSCDGEGDVSCRQNVNQRYGDAYTGHCTHLGCFITLSGKTPNLPPPPPPPPDDDDGGDDDGGGDDDTPPPPPPPPSPICVGNMSEIDCQGVRGYCEFVSGRGRACVTDILDICNQDDGENKCDTIARSWNLDGECMKIHGNKSSCVIGLAPVSPPPPPPPPDDDDDTPPPPPPDDDTPPSTSPLLSMVEGGLMRIASYAYGEMIWAKFPLSYCSEDISNANKLTKVQIVDPEGGIHQVEPVYSHSSICATNSNLGWYTITWERHKIWKGYWSSKEWEWSDAELWHDGKLVETLRFSTGSTPPPPPPPPPSLISTLPVRGKIMTIAASASINRELTIVVNFPSSYCPGITNEKKLAKIQILNPEGDINDGPQFFPRPCDTDYSTGIYIPKQWLGSKWYDAELWYDGKLIETLRFSYSSITPPPTPTPTPTPTPQPTPVPQPPPTPSDDDDDTLPPSPPSPPPVLAEGVIMRKIKQLSLEKLYILVNFPSSYCPGITTGKQTKVQIVDPGGGIHQSLPINPRDCDTNYPTAVLDNKREWYDPELWYNAELWYNNKLLETIKFSASSIPQPPPPTPTPTPTPQPTPTPTPTPQPTPTPSPTPTPQPTPQPTPNGILEELRDYYEEMKEARAEAREEYSEARQTQRDEYAERKDEIKSAYTEARNEGKSEYTSSREELTQWYNSEKQGARDAYDEVRQEYAEVSAAYTRAREQFGSSSDEAADAREERDSAREARNEAREEYTSARLNQREEYSERKDEIRATYTEARNEAKSEYDSARAELSEWYNSEKAEAIAAYDAVKAEYDAARAAYNSARSAR